MTDPIFPEQRATLRTWPLPTSRPTSPPSWGAPRRSTGLIVNGANADGPALVVVLEDAHDAPRAFRLRVLQG